jgi:hypothetical protein
MNSLHFIRLASIVCASALSLTGCVSGNSRAQADYDRGQSDAVKELFWAKERAKQTGATNAPDQQEYLEIPVEDASDAPIKQVPHTVVLPVLATHPN